MIYYGYMLLQTQISSILRIDVGWASKKFFKNFLAKIFKRDFANKSTNNFHEKSLFSVFYVYKKFLQWDEIYEYSEGIFLRKNFDLDHANFELCFRS